MRTVVSYSRGGQIRDRPHVPTPFTSLNCRPMHVPPSRLFSESIPTSSLKRHINLESNFHQKNPRFAKFELNKTLDQTTDLRLNGRRQIHGWNECEVVGLGLRWQTILSMDFSTSYERERAIEIKDQFDSAKSREFWRGTSSDYGEKQDVLLRKTANGRTTETEQCFGAMKLPNLSNKWFMWTSITQSLLL